MTKVEPATRSIEDRRRAAARILAKAVIALHAAGEHNAAKTIQAESERVVAEAVR